jgi:cation diffusion facilitator family transporter
MNVRVQSSADRRALTFAMSLSLVTGLVMFAIKVGAYLLTGSAAILSDAAESVVHVAAVGFAAYSLRISYKPADASHLYGHAKIAFFSAGFEGAMIFLAGLFIIYESIHKWLAGLRLENLGFGAVLTAGAVVINAALGGYLVWLGRKKQSLILVANGKHVLTDVWTSLAVLIGLGLTLLTGWLAFDPICGIAMALNILWSGTSLMRSATTGLMDAADPATQQKLVALLDRETAARGLSYHELRHRNLGDAHWVEVHLLFPDGMALREAHRVATEIERVIETALEPRAHVTTHLESVVDHAELHPAEI